MSGLSRIGVAIDSGLLDKFDRSKAYRDLVRGELVEQTPEAPDSQVIAKDVKHRWLTIATAGAV
jgi:hypothetical protein